MKVLLSAIFMFCTINQLSYSLYIIDPKQYFRITDFKVEQGNISTILGLKLSAIKFFAEQTVDKTRSNTICTTTSCEFEPGESEVLHSLEF